MKKLTIALCLLLFGSGAWAESGTLSANGTVDARVSNSAVLILGGTFGSGTITLYLVGADGTPYPLGQTYTAADVDVINLGDATGRVQIALTGATSPSIFWEVRD